MRQNLLTVFCIERNVSVKEEAYWNTSHILEKGHHEYWPY